MEKFSILIEEYIRKKQEAKGRDVSIVDWLDSAADRASKVAIATHVLKFSHSDAKGTSINAISDDSYTAQSEFDDYLSTKSLEVVRGDIVCSTAALMDVASFLQLEAGGVALWNLIAKDDASPFASFAQSEVQLTRWMQGFKSVLSSSKPSSHALAKQIYFPVGKQQDHSEQKYHLISPLYASSLSQALYEKIKNDRFGEKAKEARKCKRDSIYSDETLVDYPKLAVQGFGGTKPHNISHLNAQRGGKSYLLRSAPPLWSTLKKPPQNKNDFWWGYQSNVYPVIHEYQKFLLAVKELNNVEIRRRSREYIDQLLDLLVQNAAAIQGMEPGWSASSKLPRHEQLWLDPQREEFLEPRNQEEWQIEIAKFFARWIKGKIQNDDLKLGDGEYEEFERCCLKVLKESER